MRKWSLFIASILLLCCVFAFPVMAKDAVQTAYNNGQYEEALRLWNSQAENGNANAQNQLGEMYRKGHGTDRDFKRASQWFQLAAKQGHAEAQSKSGRVISCWQGCKKIPNRQ